MFKDKKIFSWALYDWANSAFSTTVMAGFFPVFFKGYWSNGASVIETTARLGTAISVSSLLIALMTPTLGALSDLYGSKKKFLAFFALIGIASTLWMAFIGSGSWVQAVFAYGLAMMAFSGSCVFYDAMLPSLGKGERLDYASSLGYSLGYLGGGLLFLVNVLMYLNPHWFGLADGVMAVKVSFLTVGLWWLVFSLPLLKNVPEPHYVQGQAPALHLWAMTISSFRRLKTTLVKLIKNKNLFLFILAYWFYIDGVYTVMTMAVDFGISIGFQSQHLISALLITQFVGFPFAYFFGLVTKRFGCRKPLLLCIGVYIGGVLAATQMTQVIHFYLLATMIGMVQGGVQSLSRSLFANMIPDHSGGEYFGFFNLIGKFASILGPLVVAIGAQVTGSSALGMGGLTILFLIGAGLLCLVKEPRDLVQLTSPSRGPH